MPGAINQEFERKLAERAAETARILEDVLSTTAAPGETQRPIRLLEAMRYAVFNGGKRLRPFLLIETATMLGSTGKVPLRIAAALECVHCYSLVHDDLPAMDDDDLRRGKPTLHRAFDEATAILAGDSLLTIAFDLVAGSQELDPEVRCELTVMLARASGIGGMAGGQSLDLEGETKALSHEDISSMQAMKTGALIRFACEAGAVIARAQPQDRAAAIRFGRAIGEAFQLADDILDVTASTESLGKKSAKDRQRGKQTFVSLIGVGASRKRAAMLLEEAIEAMAPFGEKATPLIAAAHFIVDRKK